MKKMLKALVVILNTLIALPIAILVCWSGRVDLYLEPWWRWNYECNLDLSMSQEYCNNEWSFVFESFPYLILLFILFFIVLIILWSPTLLILLNSLTAPKKHAK